MMNLIVEENLISCRKDSPDSHGVALPDNGGYHQPDLRAEYQRPGGVEHDVASWGTHR